MSNYIISPSASRDLNEIADYFLPRNLEAGEKLFREFNKKCQNVRVVSGYRDLESLFEDEE